MLDLLRHLKRDDAIFIRRRLSALAGSLTTQVAQLCEPVQEQVEVDETAIRLPSGERPLYAGIVQWFSKPQPPLQVVARTYIITREDVDASQTPQKHILSGPASDSADGEQA